MPLRTPALEAWFNSHEAGSTHFFGMTMVQALTGPELARYLEPGFGAAQLGFGYVPTPGSPSLRALIAADLGLTPEQIVLTSGATEANHTALRALLRPGDQVALQDPIYYAFGNLIEELGAIAAPWTLSAEPHQPANVEELLALIARGVRLVVLNTPHNPTGRLLEHSELERIARAVAASPETYLLVDEIYRLPSDASAAKLGPRVLVSDAVSKRWSLPGLRIGWLASRDAILAQCLPYHEHATCCVARPSEAILEALWPRRHELWADNARVTLRNRAIFEAWLATVRPQARAAMPPVGVMTLLQPTRPCDDVALALELRERYGVFVLPGSTLGYPGTLRVGFGHRDARALRDGLEVLGAGLRALVPAGSLA